MSLGATEIMLGMLLAVLLFGVATWMMSRKKRIP